MADVLIVDDEPSVLELLARVVNEEGYSVATAPDGQSALAALDDVQPSLVLADNMMPRLTGAELAATIGARASSRPPVVVMSADPQALREIGGAAATVRKPFDLHTLVELTHRFCSSKGTAPEGCPR